MLHVRPKIRHIECLTPDPPRFDAAPLITLAAIKRLIGGLSSPFLTRLSRRIQAAVLSFTAGVMPPLLTLGRSFHVWSHSGA